MGIVVARVLGKVIGISIAAWALTRFTRLNLPATLELSEVIGIGFMAGMGLTVSLVIAEITVKPNELVFVKSGLFYAALASALLGISWFFTIAKLGQKNGAPRQD